MMLPPDSSRIPVVNPLTQELERRVEAVRRANDLFDSRRAETVDRWQREQQRFKEVVARGLADTAVRLDGDANLEEVEKTLGTARGMDADLEELVAERRPRTRKALVSRVRSFVEGQEDVAGFVAPMERSLARLQEMDPAPVDKARAEYRTISEATDKLLAMQAPELREVTEGTERDLAARTAAVDDWAERTGKRADNATARARRSFAELRPAESPAAKAEQARALASALKRDVSAMAALAKLPRGSTVSTPDARCLTSDVAFAACDASDPKQR